MPHLAGTWPFSPECKDVVKNIKSHVCYLPTAIALRVVTTTRATHLAQSHESLKSMFCLRPFHNTDNCSAN